MTLGWRVIAVFMIQAALLVYMITDRQYILERGTSIVLETLPVDPRSLFSGDYVRLNYRINHLSLDKIAVDKVEGGPDFQAHETVYVLLRRAGQYWEPVSIHRSPLTAPAEHVMLRGEVVRAGANWDPAQGRVAEQRQVQLRYGIESYFVPEGDGRTIERPAPGETVSMRIAVDARGRAAIQALLVNGQERYTEKLF